MTPASREANVLWEGEASDVLLPLQCHGRSPSGLHSEATFVEVLPDYSGKNSSSLVTFCHITLLRSFMGIMMG